MEKAVAIGIDIGGTYTKYGIVSREGDMLAQDKFSTRKYEKLDDYLDALVTEINQAIDSLGEEVKLSGIGIGAPNGNYFNGTIENAPNLSWEGVVPFVEEFKKRLHVPMVLTNDANAAAIGEMIYGAAQGMKDFIVITLGTGLGSGLVVNGQLVYGHDGFAGELGHTIAKFNGRECNCGRRGCLETYASASGIKRTVYKLQADSNTPSTLRGITFEDLTSRGITEAAEEGDLLALEAFEYTGQILGMKLADTVAHTRPEAIFLVGGLAMAGDYLFKPVEHHLNQNLMDIYRGKVKLLPSALKGKNVAVLGASALVWQEQDTSEEASVHA